MKARTPEQTANLRWLLEAVDSLLEDPYLEIGFMSEASPLPEDSSIFYRSLLGWYKHFEGITDAQLTYRNATALSDHFGITYPITDILFGYRPHPDNRFATEHQLDREHADYDRDVVLEELQCRRDTIEQLLL